MINKKIGLLTLGLALASLASCGGDNKPVITFSCPGTDQVFMEKLAKEFLEANPDFAYNIKFGVTIGEGEVKTKVIEDKNAAPDVVLVADDNIRDLVDGRLIAEWTADEVAEMTKNNGELAVGSMQIKGKTYGIPYRGDNGYQLIYDKTLVKESDTKTLEGLLEAAKTGGWKLAYAIDDAWYTPAPFFANGVTLGFNAADEFECDISSQKGVEVMSAYTKLWAKYGGTSWVSETGDKNWGPAAGENRWGAAIVWNAFTAAEQAIGEGKVGVAQLPTVKIAGQDKQLVTYAGYKGVGVILKDKDDTAKIAAAKEFAKFVANPTNQEKRLVELKQGVTDLEVAKKTQLWESNPFLGSLVAQQNAGAAVVQATHAKQTWWDAGKILMQTVTTQTAELTEAEIKVALETCQNAVLAK